MEPALLAPSPADFDCPPHMTNGEGRPRTVGIEVEFAGLSAVAAADTLARALGGAVVEEDPHAFVVQGSEIGDISVTLDVRHLHLGKGDGTLLGSVVPTLASWIGSAASVIVPCEFVTAPIPFDRMHEVDRAVAALRAAGAKGTQDGALYAFGLHFNPEAPRLDVETIASILKAFTLLDAWLRREVAPDATRSLLGFATRSRTITSAGLSHSITGRTCRPSSTIISPPTRPATATSTCFPCCSTSARIASGPCSPMKRSTRARPFTTVCRTRG